MGVGEELGWGEGRVLFYKMVKIPGCLYAYGDDPVGGAIGTVGQNRETSDVLEKTGRGEILSQAEGLALNRVPTVVHQYHQAGCLNVYANAVLSEQQSE